MRKEPVTFYSEGMKLVGDVYLPDGLKAGEKRAGIVLCHGYTGVKDLYLPDNARVLTERGYVVLTFDYKGWGESEGPRGRLDPYGRVADARAAVTFLSLRPEVDAERIGVFGTSYGVATVVWLAAHDERVKCTVCSVGVGHGRRWMRSVRTPDQFADLIAASEKDRAEAVRTGKSAPGERDHILALDRKSAALAAEARKKNPAAVSTIPTEFIDETLQFNPEWVVDRIAPRPILFVTTVDDRVAPPEETYALYEKAGEPKKLVALSGFGHYEIYSGPAFDSLMREMVAFCEEWIPPRG
jgi:cephalosporin-C deacetylase-like acetyl esterase